MMCCELMHDDDAVQDAAPEGLSYLLPLPATRKAVPSDKDVLQTIRWLAGQLLARDVDGDRIRDRWQLMGMAYTELLATYGAERAVEHEAKVVAAVDRMWAAIQNVRMAQEQNVRGLAA